MVSNTYVCHRTTPAVGVHPRPRAIQHRPRDDCRASSAAETHLHLRPPTVSTKITTLSSKETEEMMRIIFFYSSGNCPSRSFGEIVRAQVLKQKSQTMGRGWKEDRGENREDTCSTRSGGHWSSTGRRKLSLLCSECGTQKEFWWTNCASAQHALLYPSLASFSQKKLRHRIGISVCESGRYIAKQTEPPACAQPWVGAALAADVHIVQRRLRADGQADVVLHVVEHHPPQRTAASGGPTWRAEGPPPPPQLHGAKLAVVVNSEGVRIEQFL